MTSLTIFSKDTFLQSKWQHDFPDTDILVTTGNPQKHDVWVLDCAMLTIEQCQEIIAQEAPSCFALLDKNTLPIYGAMLMDAEIPILQTPLNDYAISVIQQALDSPIPYNDDLTDTRDTYSNLAIDFARHTENPKELINDIAQAVHDTMKADWVAFLSLPFDENDDYMVEVLGMVGMNADDDAQQLVRSDGYTLQIMKTNYPVVIPNFDDYDLDDIKINPYLIEAGFKSGLGLPLLLGDGVPFGVMWVMYKRPRKFAFEDVRHMQVYASHAALAYNFPVQKKLIQQWQKASERIFTRYEEFTNFDSTLQHITEGIHASLDCDVVTLYIYYAAHNELSPPYEQGANYPDDLHQGETVQHNSVIYQMLEQSKPLILENAPADYRFAQTKFLKREGIQSVVAMPLQHANEKVGILFINYRHHRHFTSEERRAIALLNDQIAVPVHNALLDEERRRINERNIELIEQLHEQRDQLQTLVQVIDVERNLSNQDRVSILNTIARQTAEVAGADRVTIRLVQDDHIAALAIYPPDEQQSNNINSEAWAIRDGGHSQYIVETNQHVIIDDVDNYNPDDYDGILINPRWRGVWKARIGLPLTSGEKAIGVMWLSFVNPRSVTTVQLSAFQSFANIAFLTKMYDIEQERLQHALKIMEEAHQSINAVSDIDDMLRQTMTLARMIVSSRELSEACQSHLAIVQNQFLTFKTEHNNPDTYALLCDKLPNGANISIHDSSAPLITHVVKHRKTILVNDVSDEAHFLPLLHDSHSGTQLSVPIMVGDKIFAVLTVEHQEANSFQWYDQATVEWLASFVGQVIHNHKQQQMREALFESSQAITQSKNLQAVLETIAEQAHHVLSIKRSANDHDAYVGLREDNSLVFKAGYPQETLQNIEVAGFGTINLHAEQLGVSGVALVNNQAELANDTRIHPDAFQITNADHMPLSLLSVPIPNLTDEQAALGIITLGHHEIQAFDADDLAFIVLLAKFAAVAIRRAREIDEQRVQRESLFELTHAAMHQVIAAHDLNNFRMIYNLNFPQLQSYIRTLAAHEESILKTITDEHVFDDIEEAIQLTQEHAHNLNEAYQSLIDHQSHLPELGDEGDFVLLDWLEKYRAEKYISLQIDHSMTDKLRCLIPKYWLQEVLKIVLDNAARAIQQSGETNLDGLIRMLVAYDSDKQTAKIQVANSGELVAEEIRPFLTHRVIPKSIRKDNRGGRGIGLFMSGIIMRSYKGDIQYQATHDESSFILTIPVR